MAAISDKKIESRTVISAGSMKNLIVESLSKNHDQFNDPTLSLSKSPTPPPLLPPSINLNDKGEVIIYVKPSPLLSNNNMRVLNSLTDVNNEQTLTKFTATKQQTKIAVPMRNILHENVRYQELASDDGEKTFQCCQDIKSGDSNLIGKMIDVSKTTDDDGFDCLTHTITNATIGIDLASICSTEFTDVRNDKRKRKNTTTMVKSPVILSSLSKCNQNKWMDNDNPNVSCHSTVEACTSSLLSLAEPAKSDTCFSSDQVVESRKHPEIRRNLVAERKSDFIYRSQQNINIKNRSKPSANEELQRSSGLFPSVNKLINMFTNNLNESKEPKIGNDNSAVTENMINKLTLNAYENKFDSDSNNMNIPLSDEGCTVGVSPYSSDYDENVDDDTVKKKKEKVVRSSSRDSALGLDDEPIEPPAKHNQKRRLTLTVTDLPLRPALLPVAEPITLPDSLNVEMKNSKNNASSQVPSKVLLEERVVEIPEDRFWSRRESAQSCLSDYQNSECGGIRYMRTPSVVVSDYSDDVMCGITLEEIEYFRAQRLRRRRSSMENSSTEIDDAVSDVSAASSCSNLYYCGSTISALDGNECFVNGSSIPINFKSPDYSACEGSGDEDNSSFITAGQPDNLREFLKSGTEQMEAQQTSKRKQKKVGDINTDIVASNKN